MSTEHFKSKIVRVKRKIEPHLVTVTTALPDKSFKVTNIISRRKYLTSWGHFRMGTEMLRMLAESKLSVRERSVLDMLMYYLEYGNIIKTPQSQIGRDLGMEQGDVSKAIKTLISKELLKIIGRDGRKNIYMMNPWFAFKGYAKDFKGLCEQWDGKKPPISFRDYQIARERGEAVQDELDELLQSDPE